MLSAVYNGFPVAVSIALLITKVLFIFLDGRLL